MAVQARRGSRAPARRGAASRAIAPESENGYSSVPAVVDPAEVVKVVLMSLSLSFLASIYPAWRAARLDPVEALRYE